MKKIVIFITRNKMCCNRIVNQSKPINKFGCELYIKITLKIYYRKYITHTLISSKNIIYFSKI